RAASGFAVGWTAARSATRTRPRPRFWPRCTMLPRSRPGAGRMAPNDRADDVRHHHHRRPKPSRPRPAGQARRRPSPHRFSRPRPRPALRSRHPDTQSMAVDEIDCPQWLHLALAPDACELASALQPAFMRALIAGGNVVYVDPDVDVLAPLDDIDAALAAGRARLLAADGI